MNLPEEMISAEEFWNELAKSGVILTDKYIDNDKMRFCKKRDGESFTVIVYDEYPRYAIDKTLEENGFFHISLYNNN